MSFNEGLSNQSSWQKIVQVIGPLLSIIRTAEKFADTAGVWVKLNAA